MADEIIPPTPGELQKLVSMIRRESVSRGSSYMVMAALIGCGGEVQSLISKGLAGLTISNWDYANALWSFILAAAAAFLGYTDTTHGRYKEQRDELRKTETNFWRQMGGKKNG